MNSISALSPFPKTIIGSLLIILATDTGPFSPDKVISFSYKVFILPSAKTGLSALFA